MFGDKRKLLPFALAIKLYAHGAHTVINDEMRLNVYVLRAIEQIVIRVIVIIITARCEKAH